MLYIKDNIVNFISNGGKTSKTLPFGTYLIKQEPNRGTCLESIPNTPYTPLIGLAKEAEELMTSSWNKFDQRNMNIMLSGISGTGKTKAAFNVAWNLKLPIIFTTGQDIDTIQGISSHLDNPVMFMFDEFEKHYGGEDKPDSEQLLSYLDGLKTNSRVYNIFTCNDINKINKYFFNRPGRILFNFRFKNIKVEEAIEFIKSKTEIYNEQELANYLNKVSDLSYDICQSIIDLIKTFGEQYTKAIHHLNIHVGRPIYNFYKKDHRGILTLCNTYDSRYACIKLNFQIGTSTITIESKDNIYHLLETNSDGIIKLEEKHFDINDFEYFDPINGDNEETETIDNLKIIEQIKNEFKINEYQIHIGFIPENSFVNPSLIF